MDPKSAALFLIFACGLVVLPALVLRYRRLELRHQERMIAFDKGIPIPADPIETITPTLEIYQLRGLVWLASGIGLSLMLFIMLPMLANRNPGDRFFHEQNLKDHGYTREEIRESLREEDNRYDAQRERSRGLAALGIVPAAIGAAYLFFYYEQKKRRPVKME